MTNAVVGQVVAEVLRDASAPNAQVGQVVVETLRMSTAAKAQVGQVVVEVLRANGTAIPIKQSTIWIST